MFDSLRNGSVIAMILVKMDMQAQVDQQSLFNVMNDTLSRGAIGRYEVDPSSLHIQGTLLFQTVEEFPLHAQG